MNMKSLITFIITIILVKSISFSQNIEKDKFGLYQTSSDFKKNNYFLKSLHHGKLHFKGDSLLVKINKQKYSFPQNYLWGYKDHKLNFRFYEKEIYEIVDTSGIIIYLFESGFFTLLFSPLFITTSDAGYYFSKNPDSPIYFLSRKNLLEVYHDNEKFLNLINEKANLRLSKYIRKKNMFYINDLYLKSLKN